MNFINFQIFSKENQEDLKNYIFQNISNFGTNSIMNGNGWISKPQSKFPKEMIISFGKEIYCQKIQLLFHEKLIPNLLKISIQSKNSQFEFLGFAKTHDNQENNFLARELRSIYIEKKCLSILIKVEEVEEVELNQTDQKIVNKLLQVFQENDILPLFSKKWITRSQAIKEITQEISEGNQKFPLEILSLLSSRLLKEKVNQVFFESLIFFSKFVENYSQSKFVFFQESIKLICEKLGDSNSRVSVSSIQTLISVCNFIDRTNILRIAIAINLPDQKTQRKPGLSQKPKTRSSSKNVQKNSFLGKFSWKPIFGLLRFIQEFIIKFGIGKEFELIMKCVRLGLLNSKREVRELAVSLCGIIYKLIPITSEKQKEKKLFSYLGKINNLLVNQIKETFSK
ncbi:centrosomal protein [Anaeramoeba ignava]|uniref:Centrosomal protein n=1 Tax=Anaeramoeba ignava TaxID=1746090 RepID=A0A9Q0L6N6_ANAIG|nr:centrosomal protein [Anaeramoeba ignava]